MESKYVLPSLAQSKFKEAEKNRQTVYIFSMCGYGKTTFIRNVMWNSEYFYFDMLEDPHALLDFKVDKKSTLVIDNLGFLNDKAVISKIYDILQNPLCWCILISRAQCPEWLITSAGASGGIATISESDLALNFEETVTLLNKNGITGLKEDNLSTLFTYSKGHPLFITYIANRMQTSGTGSSSVVPFDDAIGESARELFFNYFDHELISKWSDNIINFTVQMSTVPAFNIPLAVEITGVNNIEDLIAESNRIDSFLTNNNGVYSIAEHLRRYLCTRMYSLYSKDRIFDIYNTAAHYYKRHNKILEAYELYEKAGNKSRQLDILIENARLNPSDGYLTELKAEYLSLDKDIIMQHPELIAAVCMIHSLALDIDASEYWYSILEEKASSLSGRNQKIAKRYLTYLDIACIHKPAKNVLPILKNLASSVLDRSIEVPEWALTCNGPTLMNGGRDFCEWSKKDTEIYAAMEMPFRKIFGKSSAGMPDLSLAESFLEKGESDYEIMRLASKGQMDADMRGRVELSYVAVAILSQLHLIHGHIDDAQNAIIKFRDAHPEANPKLLKNVDTLLCRISLLTNDTEAINAWLKNAPDENQDFNVLYRYIYMCKIRCYLAVNNLTGAYTLLNKMMYYADVCERTFIRIECLILMAVWEYRSGLDKWDSTLSEALAMAEEYHFIRVVSRESAAVYDMLKKCSYKYTDADYKKQLFEEVESIMKLYPAYLNIESDNQASISDNALEILKLQAKGLSNDEIAKALFISKNTVKYHCKENYRKLGVNSRYAAITEAKKRGIID